MGMGLGGSVLVAASSMAVGQVFVGAQVPAVDDGSLAGRVLMQVSTGTDDEFQLAIGDVATGEVVLVGKPTVDRSREDFTGPFGVIEVDGSVVVSGLASNPVVVAADGSMSEFVFDGGIREVPRDLGDGEHYLVDAGIYTRSTGNFRPLESFSADLAGWDIHVEELDGDWLRVSNENATVYVRLSDLDNARRFPDVGLAFVDVRADGLAVWEEDREGASALMTADLSAPGPHDVVAREVYVAEPSVNMRGRVGELVLVGRTDLILVDPMTGDVVRNVTDAFGLPALPGGAWVIGDGPLVELFPRSGDAELVNLDTGERWPHDGGRVVLHTDQWLLWQSREGFRVIDPVAGFVGEIPVGDLGSGMWEVLEVGDRALFADCTAPGSVIVDPGALTVSLAPAMCHVVATADGAFVAGATTLPWDDRGLCSDTLIVEEVGVGAVRAFPSGCPLAWLIEP